VCAVLSRGNGGTINGNDPVNGNLGATDLIGSFKTEARSALDLPTRRDRSFPEPSVGLFCGRVHQTVRVTRAMVDGWQLVCYAVPANRLRPSARA
jgi:hypothetical protein